MNTTKFFNFWLESKKPDLQKSTYEAYVIYFNVHILPYFDKLGKPLEEIKPIDIRNYITEKLSGGRHDKKMGGLSKVSVQKHLNIIKQVLNEAVILEIIPRSPASMIRMKPTPNISSNAKFVSARQIQLILKAFEGHWLFPVVIMTVSLGLRRSEVLGLKWDVIDFENKSVVIMRTVVKATTVEAKDRTKTPSSRRVLPLSDNLLSMLSIMYENRVNDDSYIFCNEKGEHLRPDCVTRGFQRVLQNHKLPHMRFHDLRHATASLLFDTGMSVADVQHWLGHAEFGTTMNTYVSYCAGRKVAVSEGLNAILGKYKF